MQYPHIPLEDRLQAALSRSPFMGPRNVRIDLVDGTVVLSGVVRSYYHKQLAQESLKQIDGVETIDNRIEVMAL